MYNLSKLPDYPSEVKWYWIGVNTCMMSWFGAKNLKWNESKQKIVIKEAEKIAQEGYMSEMERKNLK